nr:hypothetical protein TetV2_00075 [Oceanusvirus sp.]
MELMLIVILSVVAVVSLLVLCSQRVVVEPFNQRRNRRNKARPGNAKPPKNISKPKKPINISKPKSASKPINISKPKKPINISKPKSASKPINIRNPIKPKSASKHINPRVRNVPAR